MPVGRDRADHRHLVVLGRMQVNAVQVITGLLGRDREAGAIDQAAQFSGRQREMMRQFAGRHDRVVLRWQAGEGEGRSPRAQHHLVALAERLQLDLRAFAQFAHNVVQRVRRRGGAPLALDPRGHALDDLEIHIGRAQRQLARARPRALGAQQHVRENRDRRPPFDDALHVAQRLKKGGPFDGKLHGWRTKVADRKETPAAGLGIPREALQTGWHYSMERVPATCIRLHAATSAVGRRPSFAASGGAARHPRPALCRWRSAPRSS